MTEQLTGENWTIYQGDCSEVFGTLGEIHAVVSDPPYGIDIVSSRGTIGGKGSWGRKPGTVVKNTVFKRIHGDDKPFDPIPLLTLAPKVVLFGGNHYADKLPATSSWFVWDKRCGSRPNSFADCELAWSNLKGPARLFHHRWMGMYRDSERAKHYHPTQKPVEVMRWLIGACKLPKGSVVLDPYMGGGATGVAALQLGLKFVGCEIEDQYAKTAAQRLRRQETWEAMQIFPEVA